MNAVQDDTEGQVLLQRRGAALHVVLSNPSRLNAMTWSMYDQLSAACDAVAADDSVRVVVLRGAGRAFAAGTDIRQFSDFRTGADGVAYEQRVAGVLGRLLDVRVPVVAVVVGPAVGAGLAMAACCDLVVATPDARFGVPVARTLGNVIPAPVLARLQHRLGVSRAMGMLLTSRLIGAEDARVSGFVQQVVATDELDAHVAALVQRIEAGAPLTLAAMKEMDRRLHAAALAVPSDDLVERCYGSDDFRRGVTAFLEHRTPSWEGR